MQPTRSDCVVQDKNPDAYIEFPAYQGDSQFLAPDDEYATASI
jgi:hypothetical protein